MGPGDKAIYMYFPYLSEFLCGIRIIVLVRVKLEGQLTERAFDLGSTS